MSDRDGRPTYGVVLPPEPPTGRSVTPAVVAHLLGGILAVIGLLANLIVVAAVIPALWVLLANRNGSPFLREEARRALNFQITWVAVTVILQIASFVVFLLLTGQGLLRAALETGLTFWLVQLLIAGFDLAVSIAAMSRARRGGGFRYPLHVTVVK